MSSAFQQLAAAITPGESGKHGYNAWNSGTSGVRGGRVKYSSNQLGGRDLGSMTIGQILKRSQLSGNNPDRLFAVGRYQIIPKTMRAALKNVKGIDRNTKFTPEVQDKIFYEYLLKKKRPSLAKYLRGGNISSRTAMYDAAREWASIPVPKGLKTRSGRVSDGTMSYYGGPANKAHSSTANAIESALGSLRVQEKQGIVPEFGSMNASATPQRTEDRDLFKLPDNAAPSSKGTVPVLFGMEGLTVPETTEEADLFAEVIDADIPKGHEPHYVAAATAIAGAKDRISKRSLFGSDPLSGAISDLVNVL